MNLISRVYRRIILGCLGLVLLMGSSPVSAQEVRTTNPSAKDTNSFCTNLVTNTSKISTGIASENTKWVIAKNQRLQKTAENEAKWDQAIVASRAKWDQERLTNFSKLDEKGKTDAQKTAIKTYQTAVLTAVATRRKAFDEARSQYRQAVVGEITAHQKLVDTQIAALTAAVNSAIATAKASCQASPGEGVAIRTQLQAALKAAREAFTTQRKADDTVGSQIKQFAQQRMERFKAADVIFSDTTKAAREALKAVFKDSAI